MRSLLLLGPDLSAVSGISTHLNQLLGSPIASRYRLVHFQSGSEGRQEGRLGKWWRLLASPFVFAAVLLRERPDIVHINSAMLPKAFWRDLAYLLIAAMMRKRIVFQIHGGMLPQDFSRGNPLFAALLRAVFRLPDQCVLIARIEYEAWRRFMPELDTVVVANAIDTTWAAQDPPSSLSGGTTLRLAYVGRLVEAKGLFEAIDAVGRLTSEGVPLRFSIAGAGADEQRLRNQVNTLGLQKIVEFVGPVFGRDKERFWLDADVLVFPTWREGLPYSLLEAMAAGVLPITCPVGAIPDVITDRRDGLLVSPRDTTALTDAIRWVHEHRDAASLIARAARERVNRDYSLDRLAADFSGIYARL